jgi:hypothetical protein
MGHMHEIDKAINSDILCISIDEFVNSMNVPLETCTVCFYQMRRDKTQLNCQHSFCGYCLARHLIIRISERRV